MFIILFILFIYPNQCLQMIWASQVFISIYKLSQFSVQNMQLFIIIIIYLLLLLSLLLLLLLLYLSCI